MRIKVRKATIDSKLREQLELLGKDVVALAVGIGGMPLSGSHVAPTYAQTLIFGNYDPAMRWLQEKRDEDERHNTVSLWLEIAITIFIIFEIGLSITSLYHEFHR
jgi:hypothetical protein